MANTSLEGHRRLYDRVRKNDSPDAFHVFLVPDRFTLGVEKDLCTYCFPDGYTRADVQSFTRFAIKNVGKKIKRCLSKEGTVILLRKIIEANAPSLKYYKNLTGYSFAKELFAAIASLRSGGVSLDDVERVAQSGEGVIYDKLSDVALIGKEYDKALKTDFSDTITRLDSLNEYLSKADLSKTYFYVLGFNVYSEQQLKIILTLAKHSAGVAMSYVQLNGVERCVGDQIASLVARCKDAGVPVLTEEAYQMVPEPFESLRKGIFAGGDKVVNASDKVVLFSEDDPYSEATAVAGEIAYLVRKENFRYRDVAVVCNNADLLPIVYETFDRCDIPCFVDEGYAVADGVFARFVTSVFDAADRSTAEDYFRLSRQALCGLNVDEQELFRAYCTKYNVNYTRFDKPFTLGDYDQAELIRQKLTALTDKVKKCVKIKDYCKAISEFLSDEEIGGKLSAYASSTDERVRAYADTEGITKLTEELTYLVGEDDCSLHDFLSIFCSAIADMKTVLRPEYCDTVFIGNTEESRFNDVKAMFIIGAADGFFPIKSGDGLIFTASDNEKMRTLGLTVFPSPVEKNSFERFVLRDLISKPTVRLYIGCSVADASGEMQVIGEGMEELKILTGTSDVKPLASWRDLTDEELLNYRLINIKNAYYEYLCDNIPPQYRNSVKNTLKKHGFLSESEERKEEVFSGFFEKQDGQYVTSVSQLQAYFSCPFKHFIKYGLKMQSEEDYAFDSLAAGNIVHSVLELYFKENLDKVYAGSATEDDIEKVLNRVFSQKDYEYFYYNALYRHYLKRLRVECKRAVYAISDSLRHSKFRPKSFEVNFGYPNDKNPILITANNEQFRLRGKVDRVDEYNGYVVIVDYKTGKVAVDRDKKKVHVLNEIYYGDKIQLYVYLKKYLNDGLKPAGVFYQPIPASGDDKGRDYAMVGQMAADRDIFRALDDRADTLEDDEFSSSVYFKADLSDSNNLLTKKDFDNITDYVEKLISKALCEITEGYAEKKPMGEACKFCDYRRLCGVQPGRGTRTINLADFAEDDDAR